MLSDGSRMPCRDRPAANENEILKSEEAPLPPTDMVLSMLALRGLGGMADNKWVWLEHDADWMGKV